MTQTDQWKALSDYIENYYKYNPDTMLPLLVAALATRGDLRIVEGDEAPACSIVSFEPASLVCYEWVKCNPELKARIADWGKRGVTCISAVFEMEGFAKEAFDFIKNYDAVTVVREYHHRVGVLKHHSGNEQSEDAYGNFATFLMVESFINKPKKFLKDNFIEIYNNILVLSGIQPPRPRYEIAEAICVLLEYDGEGVVYCPYAGIGIPGAMIEAGSNLYEDGDRDPKLLVAARLLVYGNNGSIKHIELHDSTKWTDVTANYVISTYLGNKGKGTAFDFCLGECLRTLPKGGRFAGVARAENVFEQMTPEMAEAIKKDWLDTILLLPFGEAIVLFVAGKPADRKGKVRLFNMNTPLLRNASPATVAGDDALCQELLTSDVKKKGYLKSIVAPDMNERKGFKIVRLGDIISPLRKGIYDMNKFDYDKRILVRASTSSTYQGIFLLDGFDKERVSVLFEPAYHLTKDVIVTNSVGNLEPRYYDVDNGEAFLTDGYAFSIKENPYFTMLNIVDELNLPYVADQLYPYGIDKMLLPHISLKQIQDIKLLFEMESQSDEESSSLSSINWGSSGDSSDYFNSESGSSDSSDFKQCDADAILKLQGSLCNGYICYDGLKYLSRGGFGITYRANKTNTLTGDKDIVVLKEFFPNGDAHRIDNIRVEFAPWVNVGDEKAMFKKEAQAMQLFGNDLNNHIMHVNDIFPVEGTNTLYYEMKYYENGALEDMIRGNRIPTEEMVIQRIIVPMCKAMHTIHAEPFQFLHSDIKPNNILIDENGYATLIDFGLSKRYVDTRSGFGGTSYYEAPEQYKNELKKIGPWTDLYSMAASFYEIFSHGARVYYIDEEDEYELLYNSLDCSEQTKKAILAGLWGDYKRRPQNAQEWVKMFPGCENVSL